MNRHRAVAAAAASVFCLTVLAGCGDDDDGAADTTTSAPTGEAACDTLPPRRTGALTVATGEPAFEPWVVDDDPTNGEGFETAVVYAVAEELGIDEDAVTWVRTGFDEAIAPGEKDYDFNVQQFGITPERDEVVDFSDGYYEVEQAIVGRPTTATSPSATSLEDLKGARLGAAIGTTSLDYIEEVIQPDTEAARVRRQRRRQGRLRRQPGRRHRLRPADRLLHHRRRDRGLGDRRRPAPRRARPRSSGSSSRTAARSSPA